MIYLSITIQFLQRKSLIAKHKKLNYYFLVVAFVVLDDLANHVKIVLNRLARKASFLPARPPNTLTCLVAARLMVVIALFVEHLFKPPHDPTTKLLRTHLSKLVIFDSISELFSLKTFIHYFKK